MTTINRREGKLFRRVRPLFNVNFLIIKMTNDHSKKSVMSTSLITIEGDTIRIELKIKLSCSMLKIEEAILAALNEVGCVTTREALKWFDTDGSPRLNNICVELTGLGLGPTRWNQFWGKIDQYRFLVAS